MSPSLPTPRSTADREVAVDAAGSVVVGIDGSDCAELALRWALHKSGTLGQVTPVSVYQPPSTFDLLTRNRRTTDPDVYRDAAEASLRQTVAATDPRLDERARVVEAHPGLGLVEAASEADLLVLGTRGRSGVTAALLGSVSSYCVTHASVPVVVIPPEWPGDEPLATVVVGIDGSANADAALRWALDHTDPDGTVVAAGAGSVFGYSSAEFDPSPVLVAPQIRQVVEESVARVGKPLAGPRLVIDIDPTDARVALPRLAANVGADLLVLGSRGTTGVPYLILGSVSTALAHHPLLPTAIVPAHSKSADR